jgi:glutamate-ammonia-ligase adenylyltransferase
MPGGSFAVVAMGKLGGREMTAASDLDLVFIYDVPKGMESTDGPKPLSPLVYYARFAQRLIAALTTQTAAGGLYEVDMRLRPSGNKGPVAVSLESFALYHESAESWTWERLALTRGRVIAGPDSLRERIEKVIDTALASAGSPEKILADACEMREKLEGQFPGRSRWDLKFTPGGLIDIEFIAQTLQLLNPKAHDTNTIAALEKLQAVGAMNAADAKLLNEAAKMQHALTQVLRIALEEPMDPDTATKGLKALLVRAGDCPNFAELDKQLSVHQEQVRSILNRILQKDS